MIKQQMVVEENLSNLTSEVSFSGEPNSSIDHDEQHQQPPKKKRNQPGNPDPEAEVIALSPKSLLATNRFICEVCNKGFQRDQNLQLHRRGHNLPWKLKQRPNKELVRKKVYVCPEKSCVHHDPARALGDLTGIKKHFCRKHGEKRWKCDKCSKKYAVQSDWKAHSKVCGTREYRCDCGVLFSRRDSFITHRAFCDALAEETSRTIPSTTPMTWNRDHVAQNQLINEFNSAQQQLQQQQPEDLMHAYPVSRSNAVNSTLPWLSSTQTLVSPTPPSSAVDLSSPSSSSLSSYVPSLGGGPYHTQSSPHMSATALLQKAAQVGPTVSRTRDHHRLHHLAGPTPTPTTTAAGLFGFHFLSHGPNQPFSGSTYLSDMMINDEPPFGAFHQTLGVHGDGKSNDGLTRDFLGLRPLSQSDILTIAGFGGCMNGSNTTSSHNNHQNGP